MVPIGRNAHEGYRDSRTIEGVAETSKQRPTVTQAGNGQLEGVGCCSLPRWLIKGPAGLKASG